MLGQPKFEIDKQDGQLFLACFIYLVRFSLWFWEKLKALIHWDVPWAQKPTDLGSGCSSTLSFAVGPDGQVIWPSGLSSQGWKVGLTTHLAGFLGRFDKVVPLLHLAKCQAQCEYLKSRILFTQILGST